MITPLGSRYGILSPLGRSVRRASTGYTTWWTLDGDITSCVAAYQAKGAADYAASKVNLVNSSLYGLSAPTADPTFDTSYGWSFTKALKNYLVPADLKPNANATWSMVVRFSDGEAQIGCLSTTYFNFFINTHDVYIGHGSWAGITTNAPAMSSGVYGLAGRIGYRNGAPEANQASGTASLSNWTMAIGGLTLHGAYNNCMTGKIQACAFYNATLTATQMANLNTAMNAL